MQQNDPSRFIDEIPEQYIDKSYAGGGIRNVGAGGTAFERMNRGFGAGKTYGNEEQSYKPKTAGSKPSYLTPTSRPQTVVHTPAADFTASDTSHLQEGQKVEHQKFGFGIVKKMEGSAHNPVATVQFELNGEKKIMLNYAKLRIVQ